MKFWQVTCLDLLSNLPNLYAVHTFTFWMFQGALDGGIDIPHSEKRFAGFNKDSKQLDAEVHRKYIYGGHVASYMRVSIYINL